MSSAALILSARHRTGSSFSSSLRHLCSASSQPPSPTVPHSPGNVNSARKKLFQKLFNTNRALSVSDITSVEWCGKQKEYEMLNGKSGTEAMKKGTARHAQLKMESANVIEGLNPELSVIANSVGVLLSKLFHENEISKRSDPISVDQNQVQKGEKTKDTTLIDQIQVLKGENRNNLISIDKIQVQKGEETNNQSLVDQIITQKDEIINNTIPIDKIQVQKDEIINNTIPIDKIQVQKDEITNNPISIDKIQVQKDEITNNPISIDKIEVQKGEKTNIQSLVDLFIITQKGEKTKNPVEKKVIKRSDIRAKSKEEFWALKFIDFIIGTNQLLNEGLTREIPVIGIIEGIWVSGKIDEIRINKDENSNSINPILIDTKTRKKPTLPTGSEKRNKRFQLMCYKYLWDNLILNEFPSEEFLKYFTLNSEKILSDMMKEYINSLGFQVKTFGDVFIYFKHILSIIPQSKEELLLRYESQADNSLLGEDTFKYDEILFNIQIRECLEFLKGNKEANFVSREDKWKCYYCKFNNTCPQIYRKN